MTRSISTLIVVVIAGAVALKADVAPFPSWRVTANGTVNSVVQAGSTIYLGGSFTKIGPAVPSFTATFDPATLAFSQLDGCARSQGVLVSQPFVFPVQSLADADGPFQPPAGTALAAWRIRPHDTRRKCRAGVAAHRC